MRLYNLKLKKNIVKILLMLGGFFFVQAPEITWGETILKDRFIYKISGEVFSLTELEEYYLSMQNLKCIYVDSLLFRIFKREFSPKNQKLLSYSETFSREQKSFFLQLIKFGKILVYSKSQEIVKNPSLESYFYLMAKKNKCPLQSFTTDKKFTEIFREIVELEIFLRSRFLPAENQGKTNIEDVKKAITSARSLIDSIDEQMEQTVYW